MLAHATPSCVCKLSRPPLSSTRQDLKEIDPAHPARVRYSAGQALPPAMLPVSGQAPLKIHSHITASATPAAHFKRLYRNCPGTVPRPIRRFSWGSHDRVLTYFDRYDGTVEPQNDSWYLDRSGCHSLWREHYPGLKRRMPVLHSRRSRLPRKSANVRRFGN